MDIERIQKINNLALDLMQQGLAKDREDAISQAEKVFNERDSEDYNQIRETMQEIKNENVPKENKSELSQEKVSEILERNSNFLVKKIKEFQEKVDNLEREIVMLKGQILNCKTQTRQPVVSEVTNSQEQNQQQTRSPQQVQAETSNHPRSGNYNENDVSIEKFFYMGNK
jgi:hypothetical protein